MLASFSLGALVQHLCTQGATCAAARLTPKASCGKLVLQASHHRFAALQTLGPCHTDQVLTIYMSDWLQHQDTCCPCRLHVSHVHKLPMKVIPCFQLLHTGWQHLHTAHRPRAALLAFSSAPAWRAPEKGEAHAPETGPRQRATTCCLTRRTNQSSADAGLFQRFLANLFTALEKRSLRHSFHRRTGGQVSMPRDSAETQRLGDHHAAQTCPVLKSQKIKSTWATGCQLEVAPPPFSPSAVQLFGGSRCARCAGCAGGSRCAAGLGGPLDPGKPNLSTWKRPL